MKYRFKSIANVSRIAVAALLLQGASAFAEDSAPAATPEAAAAAAPASTITPWGIDAGDLTTDPSIRMGMLPNGMRYAIKHNETPKGGASVRMHVGFGSTGEADDEQGLAHFIEHMAFNGSTNVPEGEMTRILERHGLAFGADTNASTSLNFTIYKLDLPRTDDEMVDTALFLMRETAGEITFAPTAVDAERGVVLSEQQTRDSFGIRQLRNYLQFSMPDTNLGYRLPGGKADVLKTASADKMKDLYHRYYRPENATLVLVGDFDVDAIEQKIKAKFSDWKGVGPAGAPINRGTVNTSRPFAVGDFIDPAVPESISISRVTPYVNEPNSSATARDDLLDQLAGMIISRRFSKMGRAADAKILDGQFNRQDVFAAAEQAGLGVDAKEGQWRDALAIGEQEMRRASQFGFTAGELAEQLAIMENGYRTAAQVEGSRNSAQLAEEIAYSVDDKSVVMAPSAQLALFDKLKPQLTLDAVNAAYHKMWDAGPNVVSISAKQEIPDLEASVLSVLDASKKVAVTAPVDEAGKAFAYDSFGKPGKVVADTNITDLGIHTIRFANGVRLNIKKTDFEPGKVHFGLRVGAGQLALPKTEPGLPFFMASMFPVGALKAHSFDELQKLLAGKNLNYGLTADEDAFGKRGVTTPQDLELQMKLLAAFVSAPGYRPEANGQWQNIVPAIAGQLDASPAAVAEVKVPNILAGGDPRFGLPPVSDLAKRNMAELKAAISKQLANGPVDIALVGDVDEAAAIAIIAKTFGALPKRAAQPAFPKAALNVAFPADHAALTLTHKGKPDQGMLAVRWKATDAMDLKSDTVRDMLSEILQMKLFEVVREKLGATYSPATDNYSSMTYPGYGYLSANIVAEPGKMDEVMQAVHEITKSLRDEPVSDDLLLRARKPRLELYQKQLRENGAWVTMVGYAQSKPEWLDRRRQRTAVLEAITAADIQAAAREFLTEGDLLEIRIVPEVTPVVPPAPVAP